MTAPGSVRSLVSSHRAKESHPDRRISIPSHRPISRRARFSDRCPHRQGAAPKPRSFAPYFSRPAPNFPTVAPIVKTFAPNVRRVAPNARALAPIVSRLAPKPGGFAPKSRGLPPMPKVQIPFANLHSPSIYAKPLILTPPNHEILKLGRFQLERSQRLCWRSFLPLGTGRPRLYSTFPANTSNSH